MYREICTPEKPAHPAHPGFFASFTLILKGARMRSHANGNAVCSVVFFIAPGLRIEFIVAWPGAWGMARCRRMPGNIKTRLKAR